MVWRCILPTGILDDLQLYHWILIDLKKIFDQIQVKNLDFEIPNRRFVVNQANSCGWLWLDRGSEMVPKWLNGCRPWSPSDMSFGSPFGELFPSSKFINRNRIVNNRFYYRLWGYHEVDLIIYDFRSRMIKSMFWRQVEGGMKPHEVTWRSRKPPETTRIHRNVNSLDISVFSTDKPVVKLTVSR